MLFSCFYELLGPKQLMYVPWSQFYYMEGLERQVKNKYVKKLKDPTLFRQWIQEMNINVEGDKLYET